MFFVIMTAFATVKGAVSMMKKGAYDYLMKPFSEDEVLSVLEHIKQAEVKSVLREMKRALKQGGVLRLSVPNIDQLMAVYDKAHPRSKKK